MSFWGGLGKALLNIGTGGISGAIGAGLGGLSQGQAQNRGNKFEGQLALQNLLMQRDQQGFQNSLMREQEGRTGTSDAWRKLLSAQHMLNPAQMPSLSPYALPQRQASDAERTGADALTQQVLARLQGGNPIPSFQQSPMTVDPKLLDPGIFERIAGYASPALSLYGARRG